MAKQGIDLIRQALTASESSIRLARTLLNELEKETSKGGEGGGRRQAKSLPGVTGIYDGESMVTESGDKYPVPENYASKSILVIGDTLKLVGNDDQKRFKQIEHVKRHKTIGILTKKEGKWAVVTPEGSYKILAASVDHYGGNSGDEALVQLPAKNLQVPWAAVEKIAPKGQLEAKSQEKERKEEKSTKAQADPSNKKDFGQPEQIKPEKAPSKPSAEVRKSKEEPKKVETKREAKKTVTKETKPTDKKQPSSAKPVSQPVSAGHDKPSSQPASVAAMKVVDEDELS